MKGIYLSSMSDADKAEVKRLQWWVDHHTQGRRYEQAAAVNEQIDAIFARYLNGPTKAAADKST